MYSGIRFSRHMIRVRVYDHHLKGTYTCYTEITQHVHTPATDIHTHATQKSHNTCIPQQ